MAVLILSYSLQTFLVVPYYQTQKTTHADLVVEQIINIIENSRDMSSAGNLAYNNMACVLVLNDKGDSIYDVDSIGNSCVLNTASSNFDLLGNYEALKTQEKSTVREVIKYKEVDRSSLVVAKRVRANLFTYYVFVNVMIMPVSSTITILQNLLIIASLIVVGVAFLISWYFSKVIAKPITDIKQGADQLALGNYHAQFSGEGYSEIASLANTLNLATERLSRYDEMRQEIFSNVSHDLKTPITNILLYSEMLDELAGDDAAKRADYTAVIQRETKFLGEQVKDMETVSQSSIELTEDIFSLSDLLKTILLTFQKGNMDKNTVFVANITPGITVRADALRLEQVIRNFLHNAVKYGKKEKNLITVNLKKRNGNALVEVIDQGEGISEEELPLVWDRYYRGSSNFHRKKSGSGLGLSIAKAILEQHGFSYGVQSEKGKGSRFYFECKVYHGNNS